MTQLITLDDARAWVGVTGTGDDDLLTRLILAASAFIEGYLSRSLISASRTELYDGRGGAKLVLLNYPVTAVTSLTIDGVTIAAATGTTDSGYLIDRGVIVLRGYIFTRGLQNVQITYTAGYAANAIPADIEQACLELIGQAYRRKDRIGHVSKQQGGETVTFSVKDMDETTRTALNAYRRVAPI